jgi:hypothetical protein
MPKIIYKCSVNGMIHPNGICGKIKCNSLSQCGAHGNKKCTYKRAPDWTTEKSVVPVYTP